MKYAGVVILYNPDEDVFVNILSYIKRLDILYVMDNSISTNYELIKKIQGLSKKVEYVSMNGNKGLPIPLNRALKLSIDNGYDFLLTMDQDTKFLDGDIDKFIDQVERIYYDNLSERKIAIYAADTYKRKANEDLEYVDLVMTSGNLLDLKYMREIGPFDEKLFIDWVDQDICYRVINGGYKILCFHNIRLNHHLGETRKIGVSFFSKNISVHSPIRYYYMTRNKFYVLDKNNISLFTKLRFQLGSILLLFRIILFEDNKINKVKYLLLGVKDYIKNNYGKYSQ